MFTGVYSLLMKFLQASTVAMQCILSNEVYAHGSLLCCYRWLHAPTHCMPGPAVHQGKSHDSGRVLALCECRLGRTLEQRLHLHLGSL